MEQPAPAMDHLRLPSKKISHAWIRTERRTRTPSPIQSRALSVDGAWHFMEAFPTRRRQRLGKAFAGWADEYAFRSETHYNGLLFQVEQRWDFLNPTATRDRSRRESGNGMDQAAGREWTRVRSCKS